MSVSGTDGYTQAGILSLNDGIDKSDATCLKGADGFIHFHV